MCIVADTTAILLKTAEAVRIYNLKKCRGNQTQTIDREVELKNWQHPADETKTLEADEHTDTLIQVYTGGSKKRQGGWIRTSTIHRNSSSSAGKIQVRRRMLKQPG